MKAIWHIWGMVFGAVILPVLQMKFPAIKDLHVSTGHGVIATAIAALTALHIWDMKVGDLVAKVKAFEAKVEAAAKPAAAILLILALGFVGGCSLTPQQIETDTAVSTSLLLNGATILDKAKASEIKADAVEVAKAINAVVVPAFQPGATAGGLMSSTVSQVVPHLQVRLATLKHGSEILGIISLLQAPLSSALGATASPTAALSPTAQMNALAFFSGVSQGISAFTGDGTLAPPPLPSMPVIPAGSSPAPAAPPAPAPAGGSKP